MYAGRVSCCALVSHSEYADDRETDRRTDARPLDAASAIKRTRDNDAEIFGVRKLESTCYGTELFE